MDKEIKGEKVYYNLTPEEVTALGKDLQRGLIFVHMKAEKPDGGMRLDYNLQKGPGSALAQELEEIVISKGFSVNDVSGNSSPRG